MRTAQANKPFVDASEIEVLNGWAKALGNDEVAHAAQGLVKTDPETAAAMAEVMSLVVVAVSPSMGWEVKTPPGAGGPFDSPFYWKAAGYKNKSAVEDGRREMKYYMLAHERAVCVASKIGSKIGERVSRKIYTTPDEARHEGVLAAAEILPSQAKKTLAKCAESAPLEVSRVRDDAGAKGIAWNLPLKRIECSAEGCLAIVGGKSGSMEFGGGNYGGVKYEISFSRAVAATTEQSFSTTDKDTDKNSKSVSGTIGVGN
jgi:hypothetical protein